MFKIDNLKIDISENMGFTLLDQYKKRKRKKRDRVSFYTKYGVISHELERGDDIMLRNLIKIYMH
jgi:hypothetical protein